ncbi:MAG: DUF4837 family protein [Flavobacteriales bacterium]|nr:DUF4837 family protein [Flavobacteriales bacterium]
MMARFLPFLFLIVVLVGCKGDRDRLPGSAGGQDEVLVVMPKGHWESEPGAAVRALLQQPLAGLPQHEAMFRVAQCKPEDFASLLQLHHTVLFADLDANRSEVRSLKEVHALGQLIVRVEAPDPVSWIALLRERGEGIITIFEAHHRERTGAQVKREVDERVVSAVQQRLGVTLDIPGGYRVMTLEDDFAWLQRDRVMAGSGMEHNVIEGLLIHRHPYTSDTIWSVPSLVALRDTVTRSRVPGPDPGSYMVVQKDFEGIDLMPRGRATELGGRYAYLMRGLFGMEGAKMGGPFVSLSTLDAKDDRIITVEGFVYAPQFDKRPYVRELEAIIFSLRKGAKENP